jgi:hypothetical protein
LAGKRTKTNLPVGRFSVNFITHFLLNAGCHVCSEWFSKEFGVRQAAETASEGERRKMNRTQKKHAGRNTASCPHTGHTVIPLPQQKKSYGELS